MAHAAWPAGCCASTARRRPGPPTRYLIAWYLHVPAYVGALLLHHERRVPSLRPAELAFRLGADQPYPDGLAVLGDEFCCLPTDPASAAQGATVVRDERALAAVLRARYTAHAARFVRGVRAAQPVRPPDTLGRGDGRPGQRPVGAGRRAAHRRRRARASPTRPWCSTQRYPPLTSASTVRLADREWTRRRESCCFSYLLPAESECDGCPRTCSR